jgi:hypothetical protein
MNLETIRSSQITNNLDINALKYCGTIEDIIGNWQYWNKYTNMKPLKIFEHTTYVDENIQKKYKFPIFMNKSEELKFVLELSNWLFQNYIPGGQKTDSQDFEYLLDSYNVDTGFDCFQFSIIMSQILISQGIKNRILFLEPYNPNSVGNHVVVNIWSDEYKKWWMLDPTINTIYFNNNNIPLNVLEIKKQIINNEELRININGIESTKWGLTIADRVAYLCRNLFAIGSPIKTLKRSIGHEILWLIPEGYDLERKFTILNNPYNKYTNLYTNNLEVLSNYG